MFYTTQSKQKTNQQNHKHKTLILLNKTNNRQIAPDISCYIG